MPLPREKSMKAYIVHDLLKEIAPGVLVDYIYDGHPAWVVVVVIALGGTTRTLHLVREAVCQYAKSGLSPGVILRLRSDCGVQWVMEEEGQQ